MLELDSVPCSVEDSLAISAKPTPNLVADYAHQIRAEELAHLIGVEPQFIIPVRRGEGELIEARCAEAAAAATEATEDVC